MNIVTRLIFPRDASPVQMTEAIQDIRRKKRKTSVTNPHTDKAKELLVHYLNMAASGDTGDPQEAESIVDEIIAAMHHEIHQELKAVFRRDQDEPPKPS